MSSGFAFWAPFLVIFGAALVVSVVQRYARDICLMKLDDDHVLLQMRDGRWFWGELQVHSKALEIVYGRPVRTPSGSEQLTRIFYEPDLANILFILRPEPAPGSAAHAKWLREMRLLRNPPLHHRMARDLRNLFNMLRNAFSESIAAIVGIVKQRTAVGKIPGVDVKATETGQKLLTAIPANFEPILEHYRSREVTVEIFKDMANLMAGTVEHVGVLEEYSDKFILIRDVAVTDWLPPEALRSQDARDRFAVLLPRTNSFVRHLARRPEQPTEISVIAQSGPQLATAK